ncbi:MAG: thiamine pyrophosphate-dependent enzyme [Saprospiraceae bacterium]|nr:thiamine pyrophosphate-dependent enzyme [Saprospiraceae bacterium]
MADISTLDPNILNAVTDFEQNIIHDLWISLVSREASLLGRKEVLTGKAKFGILGDGKEVPQVAMARAFQKGDWRSGYYRDQTFALATEICGVKEYFAQLYADSDNDTQSKGRQMNAHFASPTIDKEGNWLDTTETYNSSSDVSCTAGQMSRALGIALASKKLRNLEDMKSVLTHTGNGNEISWCTIGDASTSEGAFWETINAAAVMQVPLLTVVWDDGYGISVPTELQTAKGSISKALEGFLMDDEGNGIRMYTVKGWDYAACVAIFEKAAAKMRVDHVPALVHVQELTQPQGHSTSGSHERYKSADRLKWEKDHDCIELMSAWMVGNNIISEEKLIEMKFDAKKFAQEEKQAAWDNFINPVNDIKVSLFEIYESLRGASPEVDKVIKGLESYLGPLFHNLTDSARHMRRALILSGLEVPAEITSFIDQSYETAHDRYHTHLYSHSEKAAIEIPVVHAEYSEESKKMNGYEILNTFFDMTLRTRPEVIAFGEDVGQIGDVNQGFAGLQSKYGNERVFDAGIREWTIMGQAIGTAQRGLRPIAEIQYLDYLIYGLSPLMDDLCSLRYRSGGIQQSPAIIRTRGHRLEGIWHAGSPLGLMVNALRGMYVCAPRNMVQAAGMYNTLLQSDDPAIVIECLNGYRLKEVLPDNLLEFTVPLGVPEIMTDGTDITIVSYGSTLREAQKAVDMLEDADISVELIDAQTLLPFDLEGMIVNSLQKTNRILFVDEDIPGGATAYMMQQVLEEQGGYKYLDSKPQTLSAKEHRTPFGSDGDYFTKPHAIDVYEKVYAMMKESQPDIYL